MRRPLIILPGWGFPITISYGFNTAVPDYSTASNWQTDSSLLGDYFRSLKAVDCVAFSYGARWLIRHFSALNPYLQHIHLVGLGVHYPGLDRLKRLITKDATRGLALFHQLCFNTPDQYQAFKTIAPESNWNLTHLLTGLSLLATPCDYRILRHWPSLSLYHGRDDKIALPATVPAIEADLRQSCRWLPSGHCPFFLPAFHAMLSTHD